MSSSISTVGLNAITWTVTGVTTVVVAGRLSIRYKVRKCFYWDDFFQVLALINLFIWSGGCSAIYNPANAIFEFERGVTKRPSNYEETFIYYRRIQTMVTIGFWNGLFSVKFTFLFFYRLLFSTSRTFNRAWWIVAVFTFVVFWACIAGELTKCGPTSQIFSPTACSSPSIRKYQKQLEEYGCGIQVGTDLIIMALPLGMLPRLQMRLSRKIGLAGIFCVVFVTIALDVLRMYESIGAGGVFAYSALYCTLELTFSTMIACAPTYRSLFGIRRRIRNDRYDDMGVPTKDETRVELTARPEASLKGSTTGSASLRSIERAHVADDGGFGKYESRSMPTARYQYEGY